jgi:hypothetical protein
MLWHSFPYLDYCLSSVILPMKNIFQLLSTLVLGVYLMLKPILGLWSLRKPHFDGLSFAIISLCRKSRKSVVKLYQQWWNFNYLVTRLRIHEVHELQMNVCECWGVLVLLHQRCEHSQWFTNIHQHKAGHQMKKPHCLFVMITLVMGCHGAQGYVVHANYAMDYGFVPRAVVHGGLGQITYWTTSWGHLTWLPT